VDAGRLSELARLLARRHEVVVLRGSRLPRREPDVPPAKAAELPALLKPVAGLRVKLPGRRTLFVYRYASPDIAAAPAPAFLRSSVVDEVSGCGAQIWFAKSPTASPTSAASASRAVGVALRRGLRPCGKAFLVVT
jgi:hypothetical protein